MRGGLRARSARGWAAAGVHVPGRAAPRTPPPSGPPGSAQVSELGRAPGPQLASGCQGLRPQQTDTAEPSRPACQTSGLCANPGPVAWASSLLEPSAGSRARRETQALLKNAQVRPDRARAQTPTASGHRIPHGRGPGQSPQPGLGGTTEAESPPKSLTVSPGPPGALRAHDCRLQGLCTGRAALPRAHRQARALVTRVAYSCPQCGRRQLPVFLPLLGDGLFPRLPVSMFVVWLLETPSD